MDLDPTHLRSLQAIVRYGGYHRAAEALHLTQPAVSRHVRRLEQQLGEPLFVREGRGVCLTPFGERAAVELGEVLAAHDRALARLLEPAGRPFLLGAVEHVVDPILPGLLGVLREQLGGRPVTLRVDRSRILADAIVRGEVDAAITLDPGAAAEPTPLGSLTLRWFRGVGLADPETFVPGTPLPLVAYEAPCAMRDMALSFLEDLGAEVTITAESPHMTGVHAAARNSLGYALLAEGADGLTPIRRGPLAATIESPVWLLFTPAHRSLVAPVRAASWRAMRSAELVAAAA